ncbi:hypothetical protein VTI28DRAFT_3029 [Corynascus sepedonium]
MHKSRSGGDVAKQDRWTWRIGPTQHNNQSVGTPAVLGEARDGSPNIALLDVHSRRPKEWVCFHGPAFVY